MVGVVIGYGICDSFVFSCAGRVGTGKDLKRSSSDSKSSNKSLSFSLQYILSILFQDGIDIM